MSKAENSGSFNEESILDPDNKYIDKNVLIVYCGKFNSMDGPVEVTEEIIDRLYESSKNINSDDLMTCPPIQLDHSTSVKETVGYLIGPVTVGYLSYDDGPVKALYGIARILDAEAIEKVKNKLYLKLSIGADFESGNISELTITAFPAASEARFLSKGKEMSDKEEEKEEVEKKEEKMAKKKKKMESKEDDEKESLKEEVEEEDDEDEEDEEDEVKEEAEEDKKEKKASKKAKMSSIKSEKMSKLSALMSDFRAAEAEANFGLMKSSLISKLSTLRASAKISPAEIKKIDLDDLCSKGKDVIDYVLKTFEIRQPVIHMGQYGDTQEVSKEHMKKEDVKNLIRLTKQSLGRELKEESDEPYNKQQFKKEEDVSSYYETACKMIDEDKKDDLKKYLKKVLSSKNKEELSYEKEDASDKISESTKKMSKVMTEIQQIFKGVK